jgi:POT family proton-dependent oligopeptide transporter
MLEVEVRARPERAIVAAQALERLAFHAVCAVLALYLNEHLLWAERDARGIVHLFLAAAYLAPVAGRALAVRFGRIRTVRWASLLHLAGLALLTVVESRDGLAAGLVLVAAGAGGAMPATSSLVGERLGAAGPVPAARASAALRSAVLAASTLAKIGAPLLLVLLGPRAAFAAAALALAAGMILSREDRAPAPGAQRSPEPHGFVRVVATALSRIGTGKPGQDWLDVSSEFHPPHTVDGTRAVLRLLPVFAALAVFWALFDQRASAWVFQARQLDLALGPVTLSPAQLQALSPALVLVIAPLLARIVFPALERRGPIHPLRKVGAGLFATAAAFGVAGLLQLVVDRGMLPHAAWQLPQYVLLSIGEVLVSVTGLELAYAQAPRAMRGTVMSIGFLTVSAGNLLVAVAGRLLRLEGASWYFAFAALGVVAALAYRAVTRAWRAPEAGPGAGALQG